MPNYYVLACSKQILVTCLWILDFKAFFIDLSSSEYLSEA